MKVRRRVLRKFALVLLAMLAASTPYYVQATDFYLRPKSLSMVDDWTPKLSFFVSNPGDRTIVLKVDTLAAEKPGEANGSKTLALQATPAEVVLRPGGRRVISLDVSKLPKEQVIDYQLVVEQLPIIYLKPHETNLPKTMAVTRYVADIRVRPRTNAKPYALTGFGLHADRTVAMHASCPK